MELKEVEQNTAQQPIFKIEEYEGPIHLLLEMFKKNELEITILNIDIVLDQYLQYVNLCNSKEILLAANYLDLAAEIILYKSKKILKLEEELEEEVEEVLDKEDLINKILEYKSYKEASRDIEVLQNQRELYLTKSPSLVDEYLENKLEQIDYQDFINSLKVLYKSINKKNSEEKVIVKKDLNISDYIEKVKLLEKIDFSTFFNDLKNKEKVIYFLAILTLLKQGQYDIINIDKNFILLRRENEK